MIISKIYIPVIIKNTEFCASLYLKTRHVSIIFYFVVTCAVFYCEGRDVNFAGVYFRNT